ncbi:MAG: lysophospholipase [Myxococcota bacterium]
MNVDRRTDHFPVSGGLALRRVSWSGAGSRAVIALVHGFAEHVDRYEWVARWLVERGYRVYGYDHRGHGESEGPRTYTPSFEVLLDDMELFLETIRREGEQGPIVLCGHSMGGLEVATCLAERRPEVAAAVLSGPMLLPGPGRFRREFARVLSRLLPRMRFSFGIRTDALSRDVAVQEAYSADPLIPKTGTARLGAELIQATQRVQGLAPRVEVPVLLLHGEDDSVCSVEGSKSFHAALSPPGCALRTYPGLRHEIFNEPERERVLEDLHEWLSKTLTEGRRP